LGDSGGQELVFGRLPAEKGGGRRTILKPSKENPIRVKCPTPSAVAESVTQRERRPAAAIRGYMERKTVDKGAVIDLHITRQTYDFDCGVKALQTVMAYYGVDVREDKLIKELRADEDGTSVERMIAVAKARGFLVEAKEHLSIGDLKEYVRNGNPVIVLLQAWAERYMTLKDWKNDYDDGHYAIVIGYRRGILIFEDPSSFRRTWLKEQEFLARWHDIDSHSRRTYEQFGLILLGKAPIKQDLVHMD
jgi:predicted double-glycine peptidase